MMLRDFKIGWRLLVNEPVYSAIVILGLACGFAVCFLLLDFVRYSFSYDSQVPDNQNVYVMQHKVNIIPTPQWMEFMPLPARQVALDSGMASSVAAAIPVTATIKYGSHQFREELTAVDRSFGSMWGIVPLAGDLQLALTRPDAIALTVGLAQKIFGSSGALGKSIDIEGRQAQIVAILPDAPMNTTLPYTALVGINTEAISDQDRNGALSEWRGVNGKVYLKLAAGITPEQMTTVLQNSFDHSPWSEFPPEILKKLGNSKIIDVRLVSLKNAYFDVDVANNLRSGPRASKMSVVALAAMALLILFLASSNFVNLTTARTMGRAREMATRKVLGAQRWRLLMHFMAESVFISLAATCLGLLMAWLLLPVFSDLVNRQLGNLFTLLYIVIALCIGLLVGLLSAIYPTRIALTVNSALVLAGRSNSNSSGSMLLQRGLSILQYTIAIALCSMAIALTWQTSFATNSNPGFDPSMLLTVGVPFELSAEDRATFREQLIHLPHVQGVTALQKAIGDQGMGSSTSFKRTGGKLIPSILENVGANFFELYGLKPALGRVFDSSIDRDENAGVAVVNRVAVSAYGFESQEAAMGQIIESAAGGKTWKIIGIASDIRHSSMRERVQPTVYLLDTKGNREFTIKSDGDLTQLEHDIDKLWQFKFPLLSLKMRRAKNVFAEAYADDLRLSKMVNIASVVAILLTSFGIYALSAESLQYRRREFVLRKLYGATLGKIAGIIARDFIILIAIGAVIGLPVASFAIAHYMSDFVERAPIGIWPQMAAVFIVVGVTFMSTVHHTMLAVRMVPTHILRN
ncbi:putative ABC transport system permease protein [Oxalobacteraceae bacterium GrIS 2.11]